MKVLYRYIALFLFGLLVFPSLVGLAHVFSGHQHNYCNHYADSHFHEKVQDCSLFHFQKTSFSYPENPSFTAYEPQIEKEEPGKDYNFSGTAQQLAFLRRGPPLK